MALVCFQTCFIFFPELWVRCMKYIRHKVQLHTLTSTESLPSEETASCRQERQSSVLGWPPDLSRTAGNSFVLKMASDSTCISWVQFSETIRVVQKPVPSIWEGEWGTAPTEEGRKKVLGASSQVLQNQELFWGLESLSHSPQSIKWWQEHFLPAQGMCG